jgi:GPH family glycoside/pentoside/hexuronide:cation symporter
MPLGGEGATTVPTASERTANRRGAAAMLEDHALPRRDALLYASGSFAGNLISRVLSAWLFYFYAGGSDGGDLPRRMPVWVIGVILTATSIVGALDDPLIGHWSDRTHSRWGRRLPFVVLATPPWALVFFLLWTPPVDGSSAVNAVYLLVLLAIFHIVSTLSGGPMDALLPEIAPHSVDRMRIVVVQVVFGTLSAVAALMATGPLIDLWGFQVMAGITALLALGSRYVALAGAWRHARRDVAPAHQPALTALLSTFRNDQFLYFLPSFILFNMGITLLTAALPFYVEEVVRPGEGRVGTTTTLVVAVPIAVVLLSLPLVYRLALRRGKAWVFGRMLLFGALYLPLLFFMGFVPGIPRLVQTMVCLAPVGLCMAGVFVFPNALMADVIDYDALRTGMRREATYYGTQNLVEGVVVALHAAILAGLLALGGTAENPLGIRLAGPVAGLSILAGYLVFRGYRLPDTVRPETVRLS